MGIESRRGAAHSLPLLTRLSMARSTSVDGQHIASQENGENDCTRQNQEIDSLPNKRIRVTSRRRDGKKKSDGSAYHRIGMKRPVRLHAERPSLLLSNISPVSMFYPIVLSHTRTGRRGGLFPRHLARSGSLPALGLVVRHRDDETVTERKSCCRCLGPSGEASRPLGCSLGN